MSGWTITVPYWTPLAYLAVGVVVLTLVLRDAWIEHRRTVRIEDAATGKQRDTTTREAARFFWDDYALILPVIAAAFIFLWPVLAVRYWWREGDR